MNDNYKDDELQHQKEARDNKIIVQLQKLVRAQDRLLVAYRLERNPGSAPEDAQKAKASLKKLGINI